MPLLFRLLLGPALGLIVARLLGPVRPGRALGAALLGQLVAFGPMSLWERHRARQALAHLREGPGVVVGHIEPSLDGLLFTCLVLVATAALAAALFVVVQALVARASDQPPPAA